MGLTYTYQPLPNTKIRKIPIPKTDNPNSQGRGPPYHPQFKLHCRTLTHSRTLRTDSPWHTTPHPQHTQPHHLNHIQRLRPQSPNDHSPLQPFTFQPSNTHQPQYLQTKPYQIFNDTRLRNQFSLPSTLRSRRKTVWDDAAQSFQRNSDFSGRAGNCVWRR